MMRIDTGRYDYIQARLQARPWQAATAWITHWMDLPALGGLLRRETVPEWMYQDPDYAPLARLPRAAGIFHFLLLRARDLALPSGNLYRLMDDYRRTERRARALEDVLLPETRVAIRQLEEQLDDQDQEEAIRVRLKAR
ncbi:MAG: V-type ATP synthase subunit D [Xanthomonadaceae bacterium]|nr:V-type ATP synthase subunit D [Xanthomonadaceae bacterium]